MSQLLQLCAARLNTLPLGFCTAGELQEHQAQIMCITAGSQKLDMLLSGMLCILWLLLTMTLISLYPLIGGIEVGAITELIGESCVGKTQFCHTYVDTCQLPVYMGGGREVPLY